jgi:hypothetical protein
LNYFHDKPKEKEWPSSRKEINPKKFAMNPENLAVKVFANVQRIAIRSFFTRQNRILSTEFVRNQAGK